MSTNGSDGASLGRADERRQRLLTLIDGDEVALDGRGPQSDQAWPAVGAAPANAAGSRGPTGSRRRLVRVCAVTAREAGVDGAGITVMGGEGAGVAGHRSQLAATGPLTRRLEDLQLTTGEGPCLDAFASGMPVLAGDLATETTRWLGFAPEAIAVGAAAAFSLPLQVGAVRLGTLDLHRLHAGPLSRDQLADALTLAMLATEALLELAEHTGDTDTDLADDVEAQHRHPVGWLADAHADVHVASGMVSARHRIDVGVALVRIRAHAFASGEPIHLLARRIIDRDLVLEDHLGDPGHPRETDTHHHGPPAPEDD